MFCLLVLYREAKSILWLLPGLLSLALFAWLLSLSPAEYAGRAYAVYGGIYIATTLGWLWAVEGIRPDHWDMLGAAVSLVGAAIILWTPRS